MSVRLFVDGQEVVDSYEPLPMTAEITDVIDRVRHHQHVLIVGPDDLFYPVCKDWPRPEHMHRTSGVRFWEWDEAGQVYRLSCSSCGAINSFDSPDGTWADDTRAWTDVYQIFQERG